MFNRLVTRTGFAWKTRIISFVALATFLAAIPVLLSQPTSRLRTAHSLIDRAALRDISFLTFTAAQFFLFLGYSSNAKVCAYPLCKICGHSMHRLLRTNCTLYLFVSPPASTRMIKQDSPDRARPCAMSSTYRHLPGQPNDLEIGSRLLPCHHFRVVAANTLGCRLCSPPSGRNMPWLAFGCVSGVLCLAWIVIHTIGGFVAFCVLYDKPKPSCSLTPGISR